MIEAVERVTFPQAIFKFEIGEQIGPWTVTGTPYKNSSKSTKWPSRCVCGKNKSFTSRALENHRGTGDKCLHKSMVLDMTGKVFGRLTVLEMEIKVRAKGHQCMKWICKCECGNIKSIYGHHLRNGASTSCGCYQTERVRLANRIDRLTASLNRLYLAYAVSASSRDREFRLERELFDKLVQSSCEYCGYTPEGTKVLNSRLLVALNGIDRKNCKIGYVESNCVPCCKACNRAKGIMGHDEFIEFAHKIAARHPNPFIVSENPSN